VAELELMDDLWFLLAHAARHASWSNQSSSVVTPALLEKRCPVAAAARQSANSSLAMAVTAVCALHLVTNLVSGVTFVRHLFRPVIG